MSIHNCRVNAGTAVKQADKGGRQAEGEAIWAAQALLPGGWADNVVVEIEDGRIARVRPGVSARGRRVGCLLPAPVNLHSHTFQRAIAGRTERRGPGEDDFWTWRQAMFAFLDHLTPEDVQAIAALAMVEMAEAGFAAVAEFHYLHHGPGGVPYEDRAEMARRIVAAAATAGLGLTLLPVLYMQGGCDGRPPQGGQQRFGCDIKLFGDLLAATPRLAADGVLGLAPHSLRAVTPEGLRWVLGLRREGPVHIHAAEQTGEVAEVQAALGARPVEWLLANAPVDRRWCLIHATHMTDDEVARLAATGAVAGLCPVTEANLGDGIFAGAAWRAAGGKLGVGTDSNVSISLAGELRALEYAQRLGHRRRAVMAGPGASVGRTLFEAVLAGGAQAAGRRSGAIEKGRLADLVALDTGALALEGARGDDLLDAWIFASAQGLVRDVWSAGRPVVREGRHVARDGVEAVYRATMARLRSRAG
jgi:formimidoylglutamate deiminase